MSFPNCIKVIHEFRPMGGNDNNNGGGGGDDDKVVTIIERTRPSHHVTLNP